MGFFPPSHFPCFSGTAALLPASRALLHSQAKRWKSRHHLKKSKYYFEYNFKYEIWGSWEMSESKHSHLRLLFHHRRIKDYSVSIFYCSYDIKRSYLQVGNHAGLPCQLLEILNRSFELISTSPPSTSHTTPWVCTQTPQWTRFLSP